MSAPRDLYRSLGVIAARAAAAVARIAATGRGDLDVVSDDAIDEALDVFAVAGIDTEEPNAIEPVLHDLVALGQAEADGRDVLDLLAHAMGFDGVEALVAAYGAAGGVR